MEHVEVLDCTLRDGAYLIDKKFGDAVIKGIIDSLVCTFIDYVEIGFFQNEGYGEGKTVFKNSQDAKRYIPKDKKKSKFSVLVDVSRYSIEYLDKCQNDSVDIIRLCFFKHEKDTAIEWMRRIKALGYRLFVQPVGILGYTDLEIIELLNQLNTVEPECFSIVDTFGSMYHEDLQRLFELIDYNLNEKIKIGFHSHNNLQLSSALSQELVRLSVYRRHVVLDGTINGMGRGAGNTPTELLIEFLNKKWHYGYDIDALLDSIDVYMDNLRAKCSWGYSTPYFIAGSMGAHINNTKYLVRKTGVKGRDIRYLLNKIGAQARQRYDYKLLEQVYIDMLYSKTDDSYTISFLSKALKNRNILLLAPGSSVSKKLADIQSFIITNTPIVISVNFLHDTIKSHYVFMSNVRRYKYWQHNSIFQASKKILTSNLRTFGDENSFIVSYQRLIKCGWENMDNSSIMLLRLIDAIGGGNIFIAGLDGYDYIGDSSSNYANNELESSNSIEEQTTLNREISEMLVDFFKTRTHKECKVRFITPSRFECSTKDE